jgi:regulator of G-protein signaling
MYQHFGIQARHPKRQKKRPIHGIKTVDVTRGKSGYGFTISGQHPCVLSVIVPESPADVAGLKTGDYVVSVNNWNVTMFPHDDVVTMVGMSVGTLTLQVAENYYSSDSSEDEYPHRIKARYPNTVVTRRLSEGYTLAVKVRKVSTIYVFNACEV